jgi:hypothetical protein
MRIPFLRAALVFAALSSSLLTGCDTAAPVGPSANATAGEALATGFSSDLNRELAALRRLVAPFHNFERAQAAGWAVQVTPCLENPAEGGMGFHYGNPAYINDGGAVDVLQPELLLFEPQRNGQMRLVGIEYIVLFSDRGPDQPAPELFGHQFHQVPDAGLWGLHVWPVFHNPSGLFADWNPRVSCDYAE